MRISEQNLRSDLWQNEFTYDCLKLRLEQEPENKTEIEDYMSKVQLEINAIINKLKEYV